MKADLDTKYFIDEHVYNCPFCKRGNVSYKVENKAWFHWTNEKDCFIYIARCTSCDKSSMHLSYQNIRLYNSRFDLATPDNIDDLFFYSVPTSFFTLDNNIPKEIRDLMTEAEGSLKSNYLTGASACARKVIYELALKEGAEGDNYDDRIKSLKLKFTDVNEEYFDTLLTIQQVTSDKVHEKSYDGWKSTHLRLILSTIQEILNEIYVIPNLRKKNRDRILGLKEEILNNNKKKEPVSSK